MMNRNELRIALEYIGWKDGDEILTHEEIDEKVSEKRNAIYLIEEAARQIVLTKLGITADEAKLLLG
jgi:hypothetical protein